MSYYYSPGNIWGSADPETVKTWSAVLHKEGIGDQFFAKFTGPSENHIVQENLDLTKKQGDAITFDLMNEFSEAGQESATGIILTGNEEIPTTETFTLALLESGHSTRAKSKLDIQRPAFKLRKELGARMKTWILNKKENKLIVNASTLLSSPSTDRYIDITGDTNALFDTEVIDRAYRLARTTVPYIRPIMIGGTEWFAIVASPWQIKSLRADTVFQAFGENALPRSVQDNPYFRGAKYAWNNCLIFEYNRTILSSGFVARALLMGAQAMSIGYGQQWSWLEDLADLKRLPVLGTDALWNADKTVFDDKEYALITIDTLYEED